MTKPRPASHRYFKRSQAQKAVWGLEISLISQKLAPQKCVLASPDQGKMKTKQEVNPAAGMHVSVPHDTFEMGTMTCSLSNGVPEL